MNVLILLEQPTEAFLGELSTALRGYEDSASLKLDIRTASDRTALTTALHGLGESWDALVLSPEPGPGNAALGAIVSELDCFSVEVQPGNIAREGLPTSGTDAQLFGMGPAGFALALDLIAERGTR